MHGAEDILFGRLTHRVVLVIGQNDHVFALIAEMLCQIRRHIPYVVDAASQLSALTKVVDAHKQSFPPSGTGTILEGIILRSTVAKRLRASGRRWRCVLVAVAVGIGIYRRHGCGCFVGNASLAV